MAARRDLSNVGVVIEDFHADDALWSVELIDFFRLLVLNKRNELTVSTDQGVV